MTDTALVGTTEIVQGDPPTTDGPSVKPGYLTTEFWQTNLVHLFAAVSSMLVFLNVNIAHITLVQGLIPMIAMGASVVAQMAYNNRRSAVKIHQLSQWGEVNAAKLTALQPLGHLAGELITAQDPALAAKIAGATHAFNEGWSEFPSSDVGTAVADPAAPPAETTPVEVPVDMPVEPAQQ